MRLEEDVLLELRQLPQSLSDLYAISFGQISQLSPSSYQVAVSMLQLMLVAIRPISWAEIQHLLQVSHPAVRHGISREQLLDITCNFIADDGTGEHPRLVHRSVREYLWTRPEFAPGVSNAKAAEMCLHHIRAPGSIISRNFCYSTFYLGSHLSATSAEDRLPLRSWLEALLLLRTPPGALHPVPSDLFQKWRRRLGDFVKGRLLFTYGADSAHQCQETMAGVTPLAAACAMGLAEIASELRPSRDDLFHLVNIPHWTTHLTYAGCEAMELY